MIKHVSQLLIMLILLMFTRVELVNAYQSDVDKSAYKSQLLNTKPLNAKSYWQQSSQSKQRYSSSVRQTVYPSTTIQYAQNNQGRLKSKSQVIQEVKSRYNAQVLKVSLSSNGRNYNVRVLMPNGKVKNVQVSASR